MRDLGSRRAAHRSQKVAAQSPSLPPGASGSRSWHAEDPPAATDPVVAACGVEKYGGHLEAPLRWGSTGAMSGPPLLSDARSGGGFLEGPCDQDPVDLFAVQSLALEQGTRQYVELLEIGLEELAGAHRAVRDDALDLGVDEDGRLFAVVLGSRDLAAEEDMLLGFPERQRPHLVGHAPLANHLARHLGCLLEVVAGAGGLLLEDDLLCRAATQENG